MTASLQDRTIPRSRARAAGALVILLTLSLGACSSAGDLPAVAYVPPSAPTHDAMVAGAKAGASEEKLSGPLEISAVRPTDHGPGHYYACVRVANSPSRMSDTYSVFYDGPGYRGVRRSVILDDCGTQAYAPLT